MRVALVLEYAESRPWDHTGPWGAALAAALAERGHEVTVLADDLRRPSMFEHAGVKIDLWRPNRHSLKHRPLGFRAWVERRAGGHRGVTLSLTRKWAGDVWVPMGRSAGDDLDRLLSHRGPVSFGMHGFQRTWIATGLLAERRARAEAERRSAVLSIGEPAFGGARVVPPTSPALREPMRFDRGAVRAALGLRDDAFVVVGSAAHHRDAAFGAALAGLGDASRRGVPVVVLMTGGRPYSVMERAREADAEGVVRALAQTMRMDALLAAADLAIAAGGPAASAGTGRLVAESVSAGVPVLVAGSAPGVTAVREAARRGRRWGAVVEEDSRAWADAVVLGADAAWRSRAVGDAGADRGVFSFERLVGEVEKVLGRGG